MSTVTQPRPRRNDIPLLSPPSWRDGDVPVVSVGTEHRDIGEPIPARPPTDVETPEEADAAAEAIGRRLASATAGESRWPYQCGAMLGSYRSLYHEHQALQAMYRAKLRELADRASEFWPSETPELPESAYYDPAEDEPTSTESFA